MSGAEDNAPGRGFVAELAADAVLSATILREPVCGEFSENGRMCAGLSLRL